MDCRESLNFIGEEKKRQCLIMSNVKLNINRYAQCFLDFSFYSLHIFMLLILIWSLKFSNKNSNDLTLLKFTKNQFVNNVLKIKN